MNTRIAAFAATLHTLGFRVRDHLEVTRARLDERPEEGASVVEWAMIAALVAAVATAIGVAVWAVANRKIAILNGS